MVDPEKGEELAVERSFGLQYATSPLDATKTLHTGPVTNISAMVVLPQLSPCWRSSKVTSDSTLSEHVTWMATVFKAVTPKVCPQRLKLQLL